MSASQVRQFLVMPWRDSVGDTRRDGKMTCLYWIVCPPTASARSAMASTERRCRCSDRTPRPSRAFCAGS